MRAKSFRRYCSISAFLIIFIGVIEAVKIRQLEVPPEVQLGSENVILDCDFDYEFDEREQLEIKWYFNSSESPFFQWVPYSRSPPQLIGEEFRGHVDLSFVAEPNDAFKRHRALMLRRPSIDLTGLYTCKVSTFLGEDVRRKSMLVYAPPKVVKFQQQASENEVNITCEAQGVFPLPRIKLTHGSYELDDSYLSVELWPPSSGKTYNVIVHRSVHHIDLVSQTTLFGCEIQIPGTSYRLREEATYTYPLTHYSHLSSSSSATKVVHFCCHISLGVILIFLMITH